MGKCNCENCNCENETIIEKLGMRSISRYKCADYWQNYMICDADETEKLEELRDEIIEALIFCLDEKERKVDNFKTEKYVKSIIENATGKIWNEIKELL